MRKYTTTIYEFEKEDEKIYVTVPECDEGTIRFWMDENNGMVACVDKTWIFTRDENELLPAIEKYVEDNFEDMVEYREVVIEEPNLASQEIDRDFLGLQ